MAMVLRAAPPQLMQMGLLGAELVIGRHDAVAEAGKLAALFGATPVVRHAPYSLPLRAEPVVDTVRSAVPA